MSYRTYRIIQFLLLLGLGLFILIKFLSGSLVWYINQRFMSLSWIAIAGFLGMALAAILSSRGKVHRHAHDDQPDHGAHAEPSAPIWRLFFVFIPLIIGLAIPAKPLSASAIDNRGVSSNAPLSAAGAAQAQITNKPSDQRSVLDWIKLFNNQTDLSPYLGQRADVIGFVYDDTRLPAGHFLVSRFAITCCVADAFAIGMAVESPNSGSLKENTWVDVKGPVQAITVDGHQMPLILADSIKNVQQPNQPYLFP